MFSSHTGASTDRPVLDSNPQLYDIHKAQKPPVLEWLRTVSFSPSHLSGLPLVSSRLEIASKLIISAL